jgi:hypothetical protein
MKPTIYLLCRNVQEAEELAARLQLSRGHWRPITNPHMLRGLTKPQVTRTPCWSYGRSREEVQDISEHLTITQAVVTTVRCTAHSPALSAEDAA